MLDIPEKVKDLFRTDNIKKNFRVHFPNGERADITNDNLIADSVRFTESLCSRNNLKFGLCEASVLEFETIDVENIKGCEITAGIEICITGTDVSPYIDGGENFKYWNEAISFLKSSGAWGKLSDRIYLVTPGTETRIDTTGASAARAVITSGYISSTPQMDGQAWGSKYDLSSFGFYNSDIVASVSSGNDTGFTITTNGEGILLGQNGYRWSDSSTWTMTYFLILSLGDSKASSLLKEKTMTELEEMTDIRPIIEEPIVTWEDGRKAYAVSYGRFVVDSCKRNGTRRQVTAYSVDYKFELSPVEKLYDGLYAYYDKKRFINPREFALCNLRNIKVSWGSRTKINWDYNKEDEGIVYGDMPSGHCKYIINRSFIFCEPGPYFYKMEGTDSYSKNLQKFKTEASVCGIYKEEIDKLSSKMIPKIGACYIHDDTLTWYAPTSTYFNLQYYFQANDASVDDNGHAGIGLLLPLSITFIHLDASGAETTREEYVFYQNPQWYRYENPDLPELPTNEETLIEIGFAYEPHKETIDAREVINAYAELIGAFGIFRRDGTFEFKNIQDDYGLYPSDTLYPSESLYPKEAVGTIPGVLYDKNNLYYEEYMVKPINEITVSYMLDGTRHERSEKLNDEDGSGYSLTDNYIIKKAEFNYATATNIIFAFYEKVKGITYTPFNLSGMKGLPFLEPGDVLNILTNDWGFEGIIMRRTLSGEIFLMDDLEANGEEYMGESKGLSYS